jgi:hypothetical protein
MCLHSVGLNLILHELVHEKKEHYGEEPTWKEPVAVQRMRGESHDIIGCCPPPAPSTSPTIGASATSASHTRSADLRLMAVSATVLGATQVAGAADCLSECTVVSGKPAVPMAMLPLDPAPS